MRPLLISALLVSLGLNATLACLAIAGRARLAAEAEQQAAVTAKARAVAQAARLAASPPIDPKTWSSLDTPDLPDLISRLRAAGFPIDVIRAMVRALVSDQFAAKRRALDPDGGKRPFWKAATPNPKIQMAQSKLYQEEEKLVRQLLGPDADATDPMTLASQRVRYGNLSPEKMASILAAVRANNDKNTEVYYQKGSMTAEDMKASQTELRTSLAAILSPGELEEYDMRSGNTGRRLRNDLAAFDATEEEFRTLFRLRQPVDQQNEYIPFPSPEEQKRRDDAEKQLKEQILAALGPVRGAEYTRATDYNYRQTAQLVARLDLPPETTSNLWSLQKDFSQRVSDIYGSNRGQSPEVVQQRNQQLAALQQEASTKITTVLGSDSHLEAYKQYGGEWLTHMVPKPAPKGAK